MSGPDTDSRQASALRTDADVGSDGEPAVLQVVEEQLEVSKRTVHTGGIRLVKRVHEEVVHADVPVVRQSVSVERVAVGREVAGPVAVRWEGDVMIVPVLEERLVWRKQLVLVEELRVTQQRRSVQHTEDVVLRREEIQVERLAPDGAGG